MEKSGFQKQNLTNFDLENIRSELVLLRGGLPSEIALQGGSLEFTIVYRGVGADFEKPKIYFRQQRPDYLFEIAKYFGHEIDIE